MSLLTHDARAGTRQIRRDSLAALSRLTTRTRPERRGRASGRRARSTARTRQHDGAAEEAEDDEDEEEEGVMAVFVFYYRIAGRA